MIGSELRSVLCADHQRALSTAVHVLIDEFLDDIVALQRGEPFADTGMAAYLPSTYRHRYAPLFAKRFLACVYTVVNVHNYVHLQHLVIQRAGKPQDVVVAHYCEC